MSENKIYYHENDELGQLVSLQQCNLEDYDNLGMYLVWMKNVYRMLMVKCLKSNYVKDLECIGKLISRQILDMSVLRFGYFWIVLILLTVLHLQVTFFPFFLFKLRTLTSSEILWF
jgi:hypothetical protein